jgi:hypothetical protein
MERGLGFRKSTLFHDSQFRLIVNSGRLVGNQVVIQNDDRFGWEQLAYPLRKKTVLLHRLSYWYFLGGIY